MADSDFEYFSDSSSFEGDFEDDVDTGMEWDPYIASGIEQGFMDDEYNDPNDPVYATEIRRRQLFLSSLEHSSDADDSMSSSESSEDSDEEEEGSVHYIPYVDTPGSPSASSSESSDEE